MLFLAYNYNITQQETSLPIIETEAQNACETECRVIYISQDLYYEKKIFHFNDAL